MSYYEEKSRILSLPRWLSAALLRVLQKPAKAVTHSHPDERPTVNSIGRDKDNHSKNSLEKLTIRRKMMSHEKTWVLLPRIPLNKTGIMTATIVHMKIMS
jgi:hypothetical protein